MTTDDFPDLEATTTIKAAPAQVWAAITDVRRMADWSPQVRKTIVVGGPVKEGTRFLNVNGRSWKRWPTSAKVVTFAPHSDFAFKIVENGTVWRFLLEEVAEGETRVTQRREIPGKVGIASKALIPVALGGFETFNAELRAGMGQTLERIKGDVEG